MEWAFSFLDSYGYIAVLLGAFVEGEAIILTASALAATGHLSIIYVWLISFCGTLFADQVLFYCGAWLSSRNTALSALESYSPRITAHVKDKFIKISKLLLIYPSTFVLSFRFIYGIRMLSPVVIGMTHFSARRFTFLNTVSALLWSVISCGFGYYFGQSMVHHAYYFGGAMLVVYLAGLYYLYLKIDQLTQ